MKCRPIIMILKQLFCRGSSYRNVFIRALEKDSPIAVVVHSLAVSVADIKNRMWMHFVDASYDKL